MKNASKIKLFVAAVIILALTAAFCFWSRTYNGAKDIFIFKNKLQGKTLNNKFAVKVKSGNLSIDYNIPQALSDIEELGLNTVNVPVEIDIDSLTSSNMKINEQSEKKAIQLIKSLRWKKVNIILEPYPWIHGGGYSETMWKPDNINDFFWNWKTKVLSELINKVAMPYNVDALIVASNYKEMEYAEGYWCDTIDYVKKNYCGLVTYKTNYWITGTEDPKSIEAYNNMLNNRLFSKVDFISIAAYFELTEKPVNTVQELVDDLHSSQVGNRKENIVQEIENLNIKWKKPIYFGELGFPNREGAAYHPWDTNVSDRVNTIEQANCFEAYRQVFENKKWLIGFSVFAIGEHGEDKHYLPAKESIEVIKRWYNNID